jgi:hypothetical protein
MGLNKTIQEEVDKKCLHIQQDSKQYQENEDQKYLQIEQEEKKYRDGRKVFSNLRYGGKCADDVELHAK